MNKIKTFRFLSDFADFFSGNYNHKNFEINEIRKEIFDISLIPNARNDKEALKNDLNIFLRDTEKAHDSLKKEFLYGKAE